MSTLQIAMFIFIILLGIDIERWCRKLEKKLDNIEKKLSNSE